jgi:Fe-S cluster biogenesis protein NfuA
MSEFTTIRITPKTHEILRQLQGALQATSESRITIDEVVDRALAWHLKQVKKGTPKI